MIENSSNYNLENSAVNEEEYYFLPFTPEEDYFEELMEAQGVRCQACYGTGLDRYDDVDCLNCYGEGFIYASI
jgi:hypothetical protein